MDYKEIIDKNIKKFDEKFNEYKSGKNSVGIQYIDAPRKSLLNWHTQSLISFLEEENQRLEGKRIDPRKLKDYGRIAEFHAHNDVINDQIAHNIEIISYLKDM